MEDRNDWRYCTDWCEADAACPEGLSCLKVNGTERKACALPHAAAGGGDDGVEVGGPVGGAGGEPVPGAGGDVDDAPRGGERRAAGICATGGPGAGGANPLAPLHLAVVLALGGLQVRSRGRVGRPRAGVRRQVG